MIARKIVHLHKIFILTNNIFKKNNIILISNYFTMNHLQKISQFLYFQIISIFWVLLYLHSTYPDVQTTSFLYVLYLVILIPVFEKIISGFSWDGEFKKYQNIQFFIWIVVLITILWILWFMNIFSLVWLFMLLLAFTWYYSIDGRVYFFAALFVFLYVMLSLIVWNDSLAEALSILAYYLLIAWVISQVIENILVSKTTSHA